MDMTTAKPFACKSEGCGMSFTNEDHLSVHEKKHEMMLNLSLGDQKSGSIFVADQTPTPTRLIKNCEEVGLFDDLRHVNPFDETFRRAVELKSCQTPSSHADASVEADRDPAEDSLHTPQVFPQLDSNDVSGYRSCESLQKCAASVDDSVVDQMSSSENTHHTAPKSYTLRQCSSSSSASLNWGCGKLHKYRSLAEKTVDEVGRGIQLTENVQLPVSIQLVQPQVITLSFPTSKSNQRSINTPAATVIPVQSVKPFILPKPAPTSAIAERDISAPTVAAATATVAPPTPQPEPSSASLTPTSQLPIKERLKVILSNSSKSGIIELPQKISARRPRNVTTAVKSLAKGDDDFMERRRAASTRYRTKMRSVQEDLRRRNMELQTENDKLKQRVKQLELELATQKSSPVNVAEHPQTAYVPAQIKIPQSTVHLVMNIPKMIIPPNGAPIMRNPITFKLDKK